MLPGDLPAIVCACHRPDNQLVKDTSCVEIDIPVIVCPTIVCSRTSRFRLEVKEYMLRKREWTEKCETEIM